MIKKLHDRVKKLMIRNEQLCNLLIDAGIRLPSECGNVKKFRGTKIWSNRITPEQAKKLLKKESMFIQLLIYYLFIYLHIQDINIKSFSEMVVKTH